MNPARSQHRFSSSASKIDFNRGRWREGKEGELVGQFLVGQIVHQSRAIAF